MDKNSKPQFDRVPGADGNDHLVRLHTVIGISPVAISTGRTVLHFESGLSITVRGEVAEWEAKVDIAIREHESKGIQIAVPDTKVVSTPVIETGMSKSYPQAKRKK